MPFFFDSGFLAAAFIEGSAAFILLVVYWLLSQTFPARFLRYWEAGWLVYVCGEGLRILSLWHGGSNTPRFDSELSTLAAALFFAAALECCGEGRRLKYLWPLAIVIASGFVALGPVLKMPLAERWAESLVESTLYVAGGWALWRTQWHHRGIGWKLFAGAMMLRGLHGSDAPQWFATASEYALFRVSFHGVFGITMGISMAVLVLEAARIRTQDLDEKLRRLALITAEATQSLRVDEALDNVLRHLIDSLGVSHGLVFLLDDPSDAAALVLRASVGFSEHYRQQFSRVSLSEPWVERALAQEAPVIADRDFADATLLRWMDTEKLAALVMIRVPGEKMPLGLLGIGSSAPRSFENDEKHFLVNVANLLGLTVQNVALFERATATKQQWADTFDSIEDLILVHSPDGRILRGNRALAARLHLDADALPGRYIRDVLCHGAADWIRCPYCEGAAGKTEELDASFGGYFLATNSPFHDSESGLLGTIHVLKDFTSRRQAENKFRNLFEKAQEGVFTSTPDGRFLDFNDAFMRILGYDNREDLLNANVILIYVDPADRLRLLRLLDEYGEVADFQFEFRRRDGEIRTAHESAFVTRDDSGAIAAYQGFLLDITDLKQAEMDIRRRNRELLALNTIAELLGQSSDLEKGLEEALMKVTELFAVDIAAVHFLDESTRTLRPSAAVGCRSDYARAALPMDVPALLLQQIRQSHATLLSGSASALPEVFRELQQHEGVQASQVAVLWVKGRIMGTLFAGCREMREFSTAELTLLAAVGNQIAATIDKSLLLNETRDAYENLRRTQEALLQSEKMAAVGQLISGVAHELNNPLTAILGYSQLLQSGELAGPRGADYLEKLYKQAQRTQHIVQSLLSFSRQRKPERTAVRLNQIIEDTLILREYDVKVNNIQIHRDLDPQLPLTAGDFNQLQQVFLNILNNALDAVNEEPCRQGKREIWIRTGRSDNRLFAEFVDSGPGVKNPTRIFDPFYTTKPVGKGTGLGLSICYGIVNEHGGEIQVRNLPPRGAAFTVMLPILPVLPVMPREQPSNAQASVTGNVLLVDDEDAVLQLEQEILLAHNVSVRVARSTREAILVLAQNSVDAVVMDIKMPGEPSTDGLHRWIEQNRPELSTRLILTSSDMREPEANGASRKSGCAFLAKPFDIGKFWEAVRKTLAAEVPSPVKH